MKKYITLSFITAIGILMSFACSKSDIKKGMVPNDNTTLSQEEKEGLKFMREEEKLARDVYLKLYETFPQQIFVNIASSEQTHMDTVLFLLNKYNIEDPASVEIGIFNNIDLQKIYDDLIAMGSSSILDAYMVGALIEELDIRDLKIYISETNKVDINTAYEFLECGSRNHLRSFNKQINQNGGNYIATYLTQTEYNEIASGPHEQCGK